MKRGAIQIDEQAMRLAEDRIPALAAQAGRSAHLRALQLCGKVTMAVGGNLVEKRSDGTVVILRAIDKPVKGRAGQVLQRRK